MVVWRLRERVCVRRGVSTAGADGTRFNDHPLELAQRTDVVGKWEHGLTVSSEFEKKKGVLE